MPSIGPMELIIVLALALIVLGPKRLPDAGRSLGHGIRNFKRGLTTEETDGPPPDRGLTPPDNRAAEHAAPLRRAPS